MNSRQFTVEARLYTHTLVACTSGISVKSKMNLMSDNIHKVGLQLTIILLLFYVITVKTQLIDNCKEF